MKNSQVEKILKFYNHLEADIKISKNWLEEFELNLLDINNPLKGVNYDGMPHGTGVSDPTAAAANKRLKSWYTKDTSQKLYKDTQKHIKDLRKLQAEIIKEVFGLTPMYKIIIYGKYIKGDTWEQIGEQISYSVRQCKNLRVAALKLLGERFTGNKNISHNRAVIDWLK